MVCRGSRAEPAAAAATKFSLGLGRRVRALVRYVALAEPVLHACVNFGAQHAFGWSGSVFAKGTLFPFVARVAPGSPVGQYPQVVEATPFRLGHCSNVNAVVVLDGLLGFLKGLILRVCVPRAILVSLALATFAALSAFPPFSTLTAFVLSSPGGMAARVRIGPLVGSLATAPIAAACFDRCDVLFGFWCLLQTGSIQD